MLTCPKCGDDRLYVLDSRNNKDQVPYLFRRRQCSICGCKFNTVEITKKDYDALQSYLSDKNKNAP